MAEHRRRRRHGGGQEGEHLYRDDQERRRAWQESEGYPAPDDRDDPHRRHGEGWARAGRYHPYFGEPRMYGDPYNIVPAYPRHRGRGDDEYLYGEERGFLERAGDEVMTWFGDEDAERRRERDRHGPHRGRGPRGYTRSDERIREDVHDRLTEAAWLDASDVEVTVENGEVTLDGHVESRRDKRLAEDLADDVSGVRHCQNNLRVRPQDDHGDNAAATPLTATSGLVDTGRRDR